MSEKHTPTPWRAEMHEIGDSERWFIQQRPAVTIASINSDCVMYANGEADAKMIVRAVNSFDPLVEALRKIRDGNSLMDPQTIAEAALKLAEEGK